MNQWRFLLFYLVSKNGTENTEIKNNNINTAESELQKSENQSSPSSLKNISPIKNEEVSVTL